MTQKAFVLPEPRGSFLNMGEKQDGVWKTSCHKRPFQGTLSWSVVTYTSSYITSSRADGEWPAWEKLKAEFCVVTWLLLCVLLAVGCRSGGYECACVGGCKRKGNGP